MSKLNILRKSIITFTIIIISMFFMILPVKAYTAKDYSTDYENLAKDLANASTPEEMDRIMDEVWNMAKDKDISGFTTTDWAGNSYNDIVNNENYNVLCTANSHGTHDAIGNGSSTFRVLGAARVYADGSARILGYHEGETPGSRVYEYTGKIEGNSALQGLGFMLNGSKWSNITGATGIVKEDGLKDWQSKRVMQMFIDGAESYLSDDVKSNWDPTCYDPGEGAYGKEKWDNIKEFQQKAYEFGEAVNQLNDLTFDPLDGSKDLSEQIQTIKKDIQEAGDAVNGTVDFPEIDETALEKAKEAAIEELKAKIKPIVTCSEHHVGMTTCPSSCACKKEIDLSQYAQSKSVRVDLKAKIKYMTYEAYMVFIACENGEDQSRAIFQTIEIENEKEIEIPLMLEVKVTPERKCGCTFGEEPPEGDDEDYFLEFNKLEAENMTGLEGSNFTVVINGGKPFNFSSTGNANKEGTSPDYKITFKQLMEHDTTGKILKKDFNSMNGIELFNSSYNNNPNKFMLPENVPNNNSTIPDELREYYKKKLIAEVTKCERI